MSDNINEELKNPDYNPPIGESIALGLQHVLAMFVSNFTPAVIIGGAAGFAFGGTDAIFLIQMSMCLQELLLYFKLLDLVQLGLDFQ